MLMTDIKEKARGLGIEPGRLAKVALVHTIQRHEGNTPCFGRGVDDCPHTECCFRRDCAKVARMQKTRQI